ncbi:MAG TPA: hypothetical protein VOB72_21950 [Candidatus Dormibacteraeota bacterium]|nr:hypothetical protein [Candidatus Dormibacteraeota bacterium]
MNDLPFLVERPYAGRTHAYDIVCNGCELASGSLRFHVALPTTRSMGGPDDGRPEPARGDAAPGAGHPAAA